MPGVRQFEKSPRDDRHGIGARIAGLFRSGPPLAEVIKGIEEEHAAEAEERERLRKQKKPVIEALNESGLDFSRSFTLTFRPGRRQELLDSTREHHHHLAFVDAEFDAGDGSLRIHRGTTEEYPRTRLHAMSAPGWRYTAPPASHERNSFTLTVEASEDDTGIVKDIDDESDAWEAYDFAGSALRQLQHYQDAGRATVNYFDGPTAEPLDEPETPTYVEGPHPRYDYHYPPAC